MYFIENISPYITNTCSLSLNTTFSTCANSSQDYISVKSSGALLRIKSMVKCYQIMTFPLNFKIISNYNRIKFDIKSVNKEKKEINF